MGNYNDIYNKWKIDPVGFWQETAQEIDWYVEPKKIYSNEEDSPSWFADGVCNTCYNCIDRHVKNGRGQQAAIIYDSPVTATQLKITYQEMQDLTSYAATMLLDLGVQKGDCVIIYMPMVPETIIAMLACARIGAVHSVVFGGFASKELATRIDDAKPKLIISASCGIEVNRIVPYKPLLDEAINLSTHKPQKNIILQRSMHISSLKEGRDYDWEECMKEIKRNNRHTDCARVQASDPLYILYTSGTTGKPKGIVRENGGHMVALKWTMSHIYDIAPGEVFWSASDVGWIVGHSYIVYAPLLQGATTLVYEGKPVGTPDAGAFWRVISEHKVVSLFTAPTAFRAIKKEDYTLHYLKKYDLSHFRALFLAGERADTETIKWAENALNVPVIDHWWQTETGWSIAANPLGIEKLPIKYGSAGVAMPGYDIQILDENNQEKSAGEIGTICVRLPLPPCCLQTLWQDTRGYKSAYISEFKGYYSTSDAGYKDEDGYVYVMSRTDDIINVAGHRLSTGGMEDVVASQKDVAECAVLGIKDDLKGQLPIGFVVLNAHVKSSDEEVAKAIIYKVRQDIGPVAAFKQVVFIPRLPKTRSGKILRGTLRKILDGQDWSMPATIDDPSIITEIIERLQQCGYKDLGKQV